MEALSKEGIASGKEEERLFPDDNFGAEGKEVEERLAGIVLHADAAMGVRGAQDITDMETDTVVSEAHEEGHGGAVEVGAVVAIFLTDAEEAGGGGMPGAPTRTNGEIHRGAVGYDEEAALGREADHDEEFAGGA